jgi:hypothetical protein
VETTSPPVIWEPQAGSQTRFLTCPYREVLYEGTRGPGKTDALLMSYAQHVGVGFGSAWRGILFRESFPQLKDVVAKSKRWFFQIFSDAKFNESEYRWTFSTGEMLYFSYAKKPDDYWNYHGHEYPWIGWEELTNWPDLGIYLAMFSCNRSSFPNPEMPRMVRATANPWGVGHGAVKRRFIDRAKPEVPIKDEVVNPVTGEKIPLTRCYIHGHWSENKRLLAADPEYVANLQQETDEAKKKAWLDGDWNIMAGGILSDLWFPEVHVIKPFTVPKSWRVERAFDWGSSKPFSVGWWAVADGTSAKVPDDFPNIPNVGISSRGQKVWTPPARTKIRIAEWYGTKEGDNVAPNQGLNMLAEDIGKGIKKREKQMKDMKLILDRVMAGPADSSIFDRATGQQNTIAELLMVRFIPADKGPGSRVNGWEAIRNGLASALEIDEGRIKGVRKGPMEKPGLFVVDTCRHWIRTVPILPRDPLKHDDVDTSSEDHAGDETRYEMYRRTPVYDSQEVLL